ncbi:hypothetical protein Hanom_Chr00s000001g01597651 [Helianthus anomalus]
MDESKPDRSSGHKGSPSHLKETHGRGEDIDPDTPISDVKGPNIFHRAKEEIEAIVDTIHSKRESASPKKQSSLSGTCETDFYFSWGCPTITCITRG